MSTNRSGLIVRNVNSGGSTHRSNRDTESLRENHNISVKTYSTQRSTKPPRQIQPSNSQNASHLSQESKLASKASNPQNLKGCLSALSTKYNEMVQLLVQKDQTIK